MEWNMSFSKFQFKKPLLIKSIFEVFPDKKEFNEKSKIKIDLKLKTIISKLKDKNEALVSLNVQLNDKDDASKEDVFFYGDFEMQSLFLWDESLKQDIVDKLLNINVPSLLLSYIRPIISMITAASPFQQYDIPFINMSEANKKNVDK